MTDVTNRRLTSYAHGGGCACKISPGELEQLVAGLLVTPPASTGPASTRTRLLVGLVDGDDAAVTELTAFPVLTSSGRPASASSTLRCVFGRSRPISGSRWIACRSSAISPASFAASSRTSTKFLLGSGPRATLSP